MLKGARMASENRCFIDNDYISSEWGAGYIFSSHEGALQKITKKHCFNLKYIYFSPHGKKTGVT